MLCSTKAAEAWARLSIGAGFDMGNGYAGSLPGYGKHGLLETPVDPSTGNGRQSIGEGH